MTRQRAASLVFQIAEWRLLTALRQKEGDVLKEFVELEAVKDVSIYEGSAQLPIDEKLIAEEDDDSIFKRLRSSRSNDWQSRSFASAWFVRYAGIS